MIVDIALGLMFALLALAGHHIEARLDKLTEVIRGQNGIIGKMLAREKDALAREKELNITVQHLLEREKYGAYGEGRYGDRS